MGAGVFQAEHFFKKPGFFINENIVFSGIHRLITRSAEILEKQTRHYLIAKIGWICPEKCSAFSGTAVFQSMEESHSTHTGSNHFPEAPIHTPVCFFDH